MLEMPSWHGAARLLFILQDADQVFHDHHRRIDNDPEVDRAHGN
jgi:hypothetical protein